MSSAAGKNYTYCSLKGASGSINVIAVVKCCKKPKRTQGSGFSLFVTITDPSLEGGKLPCILFNDSVGHLPPIKEPGDVIVMHRLVVREFRQGFQGCGYANTGFAATVFSGRLTDPLTPRPCEATCSYNQSELARVRELRAWYHSPSCPVERELGSGSNPPSPTLTRSDVCNTTAATDGGYPTGLGGSQAVTVRRMWNTNVGEFISIQGQVVSIYRHTSENYCAILYLWDGLPPTHGVRSDPSAATQPQPRSRFFGVPPDYLAHLSATASHHPELVAITAHGFSDDDNPDTDVSSWAVPVVVYDEHAASQTMLDLEPGDLVQVNNAHVLLCRQPDCSVPGCLRLVVHGGGHRYARGIQRLGSASLLDEFASCVDSSNHQPLPDHLQSVNRFGLLKNLRDGILHRPPFLKMPGSPTTPLTMDQLCTLPNLCNRMEAEKFQLSTPTDARDIVAARIPPDSWLLLPDGRGSNAGHRKSVCVRLAARVRDVCPRRPDELRDLVLLACKTCQSAVRVSCLLDPSEEVCRCSQSRQTRNGRPDPLSVVPFVFLVMQDATRSWVLNASGTRALKLLRIPHLSTDQLIEELITAQSTADPTRASSCSGTPTVDAFLQAVQSLRNQWLNVLVRASWRTQWDFCMPSCLDALQMKMELWDNDGHT